MNQHFPSRKTSRRSGPASSPPGQPQAAGPLPWAQQRSRPSPRTLARGSVAGQGTGTAGTPAPTAVPRGARLFASPRGIRSRFSPSASPFLLSASPRERPRPCALPRAGHGSPSADRLRHRRAAPLRGSAPCRAISPRGSGLFPATPQPCSQMTGHATLGRTAHHGPPAHGAGSRLKVK